MLIKLQVKKELGALVVHSRDPATLPTDNVDSLLRGRRHCNPLIVDAHPAYAMYLFSVTGIVAYRVFI